MDDNNKIGVENSSGFVWNGYEMVTSARYCEQRAEGVTGPNGVALPPLLPCTPLKTGGGFTGYGDLNMSEPRASLGQLGSFDSALAPIHHELHIETEGAESMQQAIMAAMLKAVIGEDIERGGLLQTPARAVKAWKEWTSGYGQNPADVLKTSDGKDGFEDGAERYDEMVVVHDIPVYSHCEHHLAAIFGTATIAYLPTNKIVGLSKLNRLVDVFARRLQVQERMTAQIADALMENLHPKGCGIVVKARHMCMESRGVRHAGCHTTTSALRGVFKEDAAVRAEFLALARNGSTK